MIIVKLAGGLGNQMFQYAFGLSVANFNNVKLKVDTLTHPTTTYRLNVFGIYPDFASKTEVNRLSKRDRFFIRLLRKLLNRDLTASYFKEKERTVFDPKVFEMKEVYFDGYWQNSSYFNSIRPLLLDIFEPIEKLDIFNMVSCEKNISLHVRRGDYSSHSDIGILDVSYYKNALNFLKNTLDDFDDYSILIFSNDLSWCKKNFLFIANQVRYISLPNDYLELYLMTKCTHNIIANSTFSWWGAWLNRNNSKIVVSPKHWVAKSKGDHKWVPDEWVQL